ncbi:ZrgA family zinc uptake protein [Neptunomonas phycophila]|uniref:ZrgA family zinc uptake protein n=1 Tax=Neptunomonas phycophila TaxID=1572645 RepID=UPI0037352BF2
MGSLKVNALRNNTAKVSHLLAILGVAVSAGAVAGEAHEHGKVALTLAIEAGNVEVSWRSPAVNLVGFEHQPKTPEEKQKVEQTLLNLKQGYEQIVLPESALCLLKEADIDTTLAAHTEGHDHDHDDHDHEEHDDHDHDDHDHEKHDDHDHDDHDHEKHEGHDHDEHDHDGHADFSAKYTFECRHPEHLKQIEVNLMPSYPGIDEIRYQAITPAGQTGGSLTQGNTVIVF